LISTAIMSKNRGKSKLSKNVLFNANKHVFHCEKSLGTFFTDNPRTICHLQVILPSNLTSLRNLGEEY
jgi:hypothetical protein